MAVAGPRCPKNTRGSRQLYCKNHLKIKETRKLGRNKDLHFLLLTLSWHTQRNSRHIFLRADLVPLVHPLYHIHGEGVGKNGESECRIVLNAAVQGNHFKTMHDSGKNTLNSFQSYKQVKVGQPSIWGGGNRLYLVFPNLEVGKWFL